MGIIADARDLLAGETRAFVPALAGSEAAGWTLRDALVTAAGCDRTAGPMAYWEWRDVHDVLDAARQRLARHLGTSMATDAERWANQSGRTLDEVLSVLDAGCSEGDIDAPSQLTMRPWCNPKTVSTCRVPFIPLAATVHAWTMHGGTWADISGRYGLTRSTTSWQSLDAIEPDIRDSAPPPDVYEQAMALRAWMRDGPDTTNASTWLFAVCEETTELPELLDRAHEVERAR